MMGCVDLPETTAENLEEGPTATIDIDATVMAMFDKLNTEETIEKPQAIPTLHKSTQLNDTQDISHDLDKTKEAFNRSIIPTDTPVPASTLLPTPTPQDTKGPLPTPTPSMNNPDIIVRYFGPDGPHERCADVDFTNTNGFPVSIGYKLNFYQGSILTNIDRGNNFNYITAGGTALRRICGLEEGITVKAIITRVSPNPVFMINPGGSYVYVDPKINRAGDLEINSIPKLYEAPSNDSLGGSYVFTNHNVSEYAPVIACMDVIWKDSGKLYQVECSRLNISPSSKKDLRITFDKQGNYSGEERFFVRPRGIWTVLLSSVFTSAVPATSTPTPTSTPVPIPLKLGEPVIDPETGVMVLVLHISQNITNQTVSITYSLMNNSNKTTTEGSFNLVTNTGDSRFQLGFFGYLTPGQNKSNVHTWYLPQGQTGVKINYKGNASLHWLIPAECVPGPNIGFGRHQC